MVKRPLSAALCLSLVLGAPGLPAYQAAAAVARPAAPAPASVAGWGEAVGRLLVRSAAAPGAALDPRLETVLGQARSAVEAAPRSPEAAAALSFLSYLPPAVAADPAAFSALEPSAQAALLAPAAAGAADALQPRAEALLARVEDRELSARDREELVELAAAWAYLSPKTGAILRRLAALERERRSLSLGRRIAGLLTGRARSAVAKADPAAEAAAEVDFILAGAATLASGSPGLARPAAGAPRGCTRDVLAPYVERALDRAASLQAARGSPRASVYQRVLDGFIPVFGGAAARPALKALRPSGEWTELVAALSLHAAARLAEDGSSQPAQATLRDAAANPDLHLAIPSWRAEAASGAATVAELLASRHGKTPPSFPEKGRLFTAFGVPVRADMGFYLFAGFVALQFAENVFTKSSHPLLLGAASVFLLYATLLAHEFGHALAARAFGVRTHGISLNFLGGAAHIEREPRRPLAEFLFAAAGPAVNFAYAAAVLPLAGFMDPGAVKDVLVFSARLNVVLGAFNLIPAYPMDGGRLLRSGLAWLLRDHYKATRVAARVGAAIGLAVIVYTMAQVVLLGQFTALLTGVIGLFVLMGSRAALLHPGTELVEPVKKR